MRFTSPKLLHPIGNGRVGKLSCAAALICLVGTWCAGACICLGAPEPTALSLASQSVDFQNVLRRGELVLDLTSVNEGTLNELQFRLRHQEAAQTMEFRHLEGPDFTFAIIEDAPNAGTTIALPGSTNRTNIELALMTGMVWDGELGVALHEGFRTSALSVRQDVSTRLTPGQELSLVGYSLGGATAVILAAYLTQDGYVVRDVLTFGQPKVTDAIGVEKLSALPIRRIVSGDDPIALLPTDQYAHCGDAIILLDGPTVVQMPFGIDDYDLAAGLAVVLNDTTFHDHLTYRERLASKIGVDLLEVQFLSRGCYLN